MTNNPTIDGVSRGGTFCRICGTKLCIKGVCTIYCPNKNCGSDAPVVERQPVGYVHQWEMERIAAGNAHWATMWDSDGADNPSRNGSPAMAVYLVTPEVAALQSTIAQLQARIAELVAWSYCPECGSEEIRHKEGEHKQCAECHQEWFSDLDYSDVVRGHLKKLKTAPPAPVAALWEIRIPDEPQNPESPAEYFYAQNAANRDLLLMREGATVVAEYACLDATAALNEERK